MKEESTSMVCSLWGNIPYEINFHLFVKDGRPLRFCLDGFRQQYSMCIAKLIDVFGGQLEEPGMPGIIVLSNPNHFSNLSCARYNIKFVQDSIATGVLQSLENYRITITPTNPYHENDLPQTSQWTGQAGVIIHRDGLLYGSDKLEFDKVPELRENNKCNEPATTSTIEAGSVPSLSDRCKIVIEKLEESALRESQKMKQGESKDNFLPADESARESPRGMPLISSSETSEMTTSEDIDVVKMDEDLQDDVNNEKIEVIYLSDNDLDEYGPSISIDSEAELSHDKKSSQPWTKAECQVLINFIIENRLAGQPMHKHMWKACLESSSLLQENRRSIDAIASKYRRLRSSHFLYSKNPELLKEIAKRRMV